MLWKHLKCSAVKRPYNQHLRLGIDAEVKMKRKHEFEDIGDTNFSSEINPYSSIGSMYSVIDINIWCNSIYEFCYRNNSISFIRYRNTNRRNTDE